MIQPFLPSLERTLPRVMPNPGVMVAPSSSFAPQVAGAGPMHPVHYEFQTHGEVEAFLASADFPHFRSQCEATIDAIRDQVAALRPGHPLASALDTLKDDLFAGPDDAPCAERFQAHLAHVYANVKPMLEQIDVGMADREVPAGLKHRLIDRLADAVPKCSGGVINGVCRAAAQLRLAHDTTLTGRARFLLHEILSERVLELVLQQGVGEAFDTHRLQACLNALSERFDIPRIDDPFLPAGALTEADRNVLRQIANPSEMNRLYSAMLGRLAEDYLDAVKAAMGRDWDGMAAWSAIEAGMPELQQLETAFGTIDPNVLWQQVEGSEQGHYRLNADPTLLPCRLAANLKEAGFPLPQPEVLDLWSDAPAGSGQAPPMKLCRLGTLFWVASAADDVALSALEHGDLGRLHAALAKVDGRVDACQFLAIAERLLAREQVELGDAVNAALVDRLAEALAGEPEALLTSRAAIRYVETHPSLQASLSSQLAAAPATLRLRQLVRKYGPAWLVRGWTRPRPAEPLGRGDAHWQMVDAAREGNVRRIEELLVAGAQLAPDAPTYRRAARQGGHAAAVRFIGNVLDAQDRAIQAIRDDREEAMQSSMAATAGPHFVDLTGRTPLFHAVEIGRYAMADWLIGEGASPFVRVGSVPMLAVPFARGDIAMAGLLLTRACEADRKETANALSECMQAASAVRGETAIELWKLLEAAAEQAGFEFQGERPGKWLCTAVESGNIALVRHLLVAPAGRAAIANGDGPSMLRAAASLPDETLACEILQRLFDAGCELERNVDPRYRVIPESSRAEGRRATAYALDYRHDEVLRILLAHADPSVHMAALSQALDRRAVTRARALLLSAPIAELARMAPPPGEARGYWWGLLFDAASRLDETDRIAGWLRAHAGAREPYAGWLKAAIKAAMKGADLEHLSTLLRLLANHPELRGRSPLQLMDGWTMPLPSEAVGRRAVIDLLWKARQQLDPAELDPLRRRAFEVQPLDWIRREIANPRHGDEALLAMFGAGYSDEDIVAVLQDPNVQPSSTHLRLALAGQRYALAETLVGGMNDVRAVQKAMVDHLADLDRSRARDSETRWRDTVRWWLRCGGTPFLDTGRGGTLMEALERRAADLDSETLERALANTTARDIARLLTSDPQQWGMRTLLDMARKLQCRLDRQPDSEAVRQFVGHLLSALENEVGNPVQTVRPYAGALLDVVLPCADASIQRLANTCKVTVEGWPGRGLLSKAIADNNWAKAVSLLDAGVPWSTTVQARDAVGQAIESGNCDAAALRGLLSSLRRKFAQRNPLARLIARLRWGRDAWINMRLLNGDTLLDVANRKRADPALIAVLKEQGGRARRMA